MTLRAKAGASTATMVRIGTFSLLAAVLHLFTGSVTAIYVEYDEHGNLRVLFNGTNSFDDYYLGNTTFDYYYSILDFITTAAPSSNKVPRNEGSSSEVLHPSHLPFFLALLSLLQGVRTGF